MPWTPLVAMMLASHPLVLWYEQPASDWNSALPIGNGKMGAMVFGGTENERIQLNDDTLWAGHVRKRINAKALEALPKVRQLIFEGRNEEAARLAGDSMMGVPPTVESYQTLGDLKIRQKLSGDPQRYRRWLDLDGAVSVCEFTVGKTIYRREVFATHPGQAVVVHLTASGPETISLEASLARPETSDPVEHGSDLICLSGQASDRGVKFDLIMGARTDGQLSNKGGRIKVWKAKDVTFSLSSCTDYNIRNPADPLRSDRKGAAEKHVRACLKTPLKQILDQHQRDFRKLFRRVNLNLGPDRADVSTDKRLLALESGADDPALVALYFQFGRYLTISSSRPGDMPSNLQGVWCQDMAAPWNADYHTNINLQMNYWPVEVANLGECHLPLVDLMDISQRAVQKRPGSSTAQTVGLSIT